MEGHAGVEDLTADWTGQSKPPILGNLA